MNQRAAAIHRKSDVNISESHGFQSKYSAFAQDNMDATTNGC